MTPTNWLIRYIAGTNPPVDTLTIVHSPGRSNLYYAAQRTNASSLESPLTDAELFQPFAGSDFWRIDLGLEFLNWPSQQIANYNQPRRGQPCRVLESRASTPIPGGYLHVKSWVDIDRDGILQAEAYDLRNQHIKNFKLGSVRKVDGVRQLEDMTMGMENSSDETQIRFNLDGPARSETADQR